MNEDQTARSENDASESGGLDRRKLLKHGAVVGAVWSAPIVFDSFASPAAADTGFVDTSTPTPDGGVVTASIPTNRKVNFTLVGGGGFNSFVGGSGTKITGTIAAAGAPYTITYHVGGGGGGGAVGVGNGNTASGGSAGTGYRPGGVGGASVGYSGSTVPGAGGGGGGASAIVSTYNTVVAPGGDGSGGGGNITGASGGQHANATTGAPPKDGNIGNAGGLGTGSQPGLGGSQTGATVAGGVNTGGTATNNGGAGTNATAGKGGDGTGSGGGGGGGGGGFGGGGGGSADRNGYPGASGGGGSMIATGSYTTAPSSTAADGTPAGSRTSANPSVVGHCGNGSSSKTAGTAGGNGQVILILQP